MKWFPKRQHPATSPFRRSDTTSEARLILPQLPRSAHLPLTVAQVDVLITDAYAKQLQPVIVVTVAGSDVAPWLQPVPATPVQIGLPAMVVRDFIDNAVGNFDMREVSLGELLDGWPMRDAWLVNHDQAATSY